MVHQDISKQFGITNSLPDWTIYYSQRYTVLWYENVMALCCICASRAAQMIDVLGVLQRS